MKSSAEDASIRLCLLLYSSGHSMNNVEQRRSFYGKVSQISSEMESYDKVIVSRSQGDGITWQYSSDLDVLLFIPHYICNNDPYNAHAVSKGKTVFKINNTHFGYCTLELTQRGLCELHMITNSLVQLNGNIFLSSSMFIATYTPINNAIQTWPAKTAQFFGQLIVDYVGTFTCECQHILQKWVSRYRKYDWPPQSIRQTITRMYGNLVAKGMHGSDTEHLEWRYCFNEIESLLVECLTDTQIKLYMMLKIINQDIIKKTRVFNIIFHFEEHCVLVGRNIRTTHVSRWNFDHLDMKIIDAPKASCRTVRFTLLHDTWTKFVGRESKKTRTIATNTDIVWYFEIWSRRFRFMWNH